MNADQYHQVLVALDQALDVFSRSPTPHSAADRHLRLQIELIRSHVLKAETGLPFPIGAPSPDAEPDPELTRAPWFRSPGPK